MTVKEQNTKICKKCRSEIDKRAKRCPHCGAKQGMPIWIIVILVILFCAIISGGSSENKTETGSNTNNKVNKEVKVTVVDFSSMTKADIDSWAKNNKVNYSITEDYSDTVEKGKLISQSVNANQTIYEGEKIEIVISLGKKPTMGQTNALEKAKSYSSTMHMSKQGIYNQLTSSFEGFTAEEAQYAIDNLE